MRVSGSLCLLLLTFSCQSHSGQALSDMFAWLPGTWELQESEFPTFEVWAFTHEGSLSGESYQVKAGEKHLSETFRIYQHGQAIFYEATVPTQNEGRSIVFRLHTSADSSYHFENPAHDFPQFIRYQLLRTGHLQVEIGKLGNASAHRFSFKRKQ